MTFDEMLETYATIALFDFLGEFLLLIPAGLILGCIMWAVGLFVVWFIRLMHQVTLTS